MGCMGDLPDGVGKVEPDVIVPKNVQSMIWEDLVPGLMTSAILPRWWGVTRNELHAVTLYQRAGEELVETSAENEKVRQTVMGILSDRMLPQRSEEVERALRAGHSEEALAQIAPAHTLYLPPAFPLKSPTATRHWATPGKE